MRRIAVIGGGWAGCAAAVQIARRGDMVTLFEAARTLGGRARQVPRGDRLLDNGQHILLGAYGDTLRMMRVVGIDPDQALLRLPLQMRYPHGSGGMDFITPRLPAPWHMLVGLWRARGLDRKDKLALARFTTAARWMDWRLNIDCSVTELLERFDQTARLIQLMWRPLCVAALNTPPERASAQVFLSVLRDSLGAKRSASDMLIPRTDLTRLFPQQAAAFVERNGGSIRCGVTVESIVRNEAGWRVLTRASADASGMNDVFDGVVIATQAGNAARLLDGLTDIAPLQALSYEPITTCYLQYAADVRLAQPFFALVETAENREWGQFVFDRGWLEEGNAGLLAVVVSASTNATELGRDALIDAVTAQLAQAFGCPEFAAPLWAMTITEKRATFSCAPGLARPSNATACDGLAIAGDYTASEYPATLESAIRSGVEAARVV